MKSSLSALQIAERFVLGACLLDTNAYAKVSEVLEARHFYSVVHRTIWAAIRDVAERSAIDYRLVMSHLPDEIPDGESSIAALSYVQLLMDEAIDGGDIEAFAETVVQEFVLRTSIKEIDAARKKLLDRANHSVTVLEELNEKLGSLTTSATASEEMTIGKAAAIAVDRAAKAYESERLPGVGSGLAAFDDLVGRMMPEELIFITGDPGGGKSSLAQQIAIHVAMGHDLLEPRRHVLFFQLDMGVVGMAQRQLAADASIASECIREGRINSEQFSRLTDAANRLKDVPLTAVAMTLPKVGRIRTRCMAAKRQGNLGLVVVDNLLCIKHDNPRITGFDAYDDIVYSMKGIARDCDVPLILLTQRTRASQQRDDPRPRLTDSYGGGGAERAADWGIGLWNEAEYLRARKPPEHKGEEIAKWADRLESVAGLAEFLLLKARFKSPNRSRTVKWDGKATRFSDQ